MSGSGITVRELASHTPLGLRVLAGEAGLDRPISWANPTDMPDPTGWMFGDELVMITSRGFPDSIDGQREYLAGLIEGGAAGLVLSIKSGATQLSQAAIDLAEDERFPVLGLPYDSAFSNIVRHIAFAVHSDPTPPMSAVQRLYEAALAMTAGSLDPTEVLQRLGKALDAELALVDVGLERVDAQTGPAAARLVTATTRRLRDREESNPTFLRFDDPLATAIRVPTWPDLYLVAVGAKARPALAPLQHASAIIALSIRFDVAETELELVTTARLVDALMAGQVTIDQVTPRLQRIGLGGGPWAVIATEHGAAEELSRELGRREQPAVSFGGDVAMALLLVRDQAVPIAAELPSTTWIGASVTFTRLNHISEAVAEARLSFRATFGGSGRFRRYGSAEWSPLAPGSVEEAERFVTEVIGPLLEEAEQKPWLEPTLRAYIESERSPTATAEKLGIHRQTLVNRLQRIEELLGSGLRDSADVARIWLALRLHDSV